MTSPAVGGPSVYRCRLEVHWRLCRRSCSASDWREAFKTVRGKFVVNVCQSSRLT